jgi:isoamylase
MPDTSKASRRQKPAPTGTAKPGSQWPLGATFDGSGVNFALFSENAAAVTLCLFDEEDGATEVARVPLNERTEGVWNGYVEGIKPGQRYGYRVDGAYDPAAGHRFNPAKLLLDPYGRATDRLPTPTDTTFGYRFGNPDGDLRKDNRNNAPFTSRSVVIESSYDWDGDTQLKTPWTDTIIYEAHVKGMTARHPDVPEKLRGTYAGLASAPVIEHLKQLGITAIELLPVYQSSPERRLADLNLGNYWGYNSIGFFAPDIRFAASSGVGAHVAEFREMVKAFHRAGIEVLLDVVYNHTAEGNHLGPTLCFRGIDNAAYYRLDPNNKRTFLDTTGCGNSLNLMHPRVLQFVMDSLRYWVLEMHVDGFRFDLATTLARTRIGFDGQAPFLSAIQQDPVLSQAKLIAEPWDLGDGGYQLGGFPPAWKEWNGKYRDKARDFWRGADDSMAEFASRFTGSSDLFQWNGRPPQASINFVTCHDGFPLVDLVSYNQKHNEANGENNQDGDNTNRSWNCGAEGPTADPVIKALRRRQRRNFIATLLISQGVPMMLAGDEIGRTQRGNNNAYCQDNDVSWLDWSEADTEFLEFTRAMIRMRGQHRVFRRRKWFTGLVRAGSKIKDIGWFRFDGNEMTIGDWSAGFAKSLAVFLNGSSVDDDQNGDANIDDSYYVIFNAGADALDFVMPARTWGRRWIRILDTTEPLPREAEDQIQAGGKVHVAGRAMVILWRAV